MTTTRPELTVIVTGGRTFGNRKLVWKTMYELNPQVVVVGDATGADEHARAWAKRNGVTLKIFKADWDRFGRAAGPLRNLQMIEEHPTATVVAFPGGRGTRDCSVRAMNKGMNVIKIEDPNAES